VTIPGFSRQIISAGRQVRPLEPDPPAWVHALLRGAQRDGDSLSVPSIDVLRRDPFVRLTTRLPDAVCMTADELSRRVAERYAAIEQGLVDLRLHAIRIWNYVPGIVDSMGADLDRYMAFNRGRYNAYAESMGNEERFARELPAASGIGIAGRDLVIDCLAAATGGTPVANPRQMASWRYSKRYGPKPPCFARGTISVLDGRPMLLVGGTASIVGEESRHPGDVRAQADEALSNIEALITNAGGPSESALHRLTDARIYIVNGADQDVVEQLVLARTAPTIRIETVIARVCRPELLVEIEGLADLANG
jgi:enamine deaminase RidA (YjgF/YER057c/UK114 family)